MKFIHVLLGGLAMRCLARRAAVACPIRKAAALPLDVMRSVRLVLGKASCHSSAIRSLLRKEDARGSRHRTFSSAFLTECQVSYMFQSVAVVRQLVSEPTIGSLMTAGWGNLKD